MRIPVQTCWTGHAFCFRALICGGLRIPSSDGVWRRADATRLLDLLEAEGFDRRKIRFTHT
jgi:hypothetical protein